MSSINENVKNMNEYKLSKIDVCKKLLNTQFALLEAEKKIKDYEEYINTSHTEPTPLDLTSSNNCSLQIQLEPPTVSEEEIIEKSNILYSETIDMLQVEIAEKGDLINTLRNELNHYKTGLINFKLLLNDGFSPNP